MYSSKAAALSRSVTLMMWLSQVGLSTSESTMMSYTAGKPADSRSFVSDTLKDNHVVIFSKTYCPYSSMAKDSFERLRQPFLSIELDVRSDGEAIQKALRQRTGVSTVPQVFVGGQFLGGATDVQELMEAGKLADIVNHGVHGEQ